MPAARKRMGADGYRDFEARMREVWRASASAGADEDAIERAASCSAADAFVVSVVRRGAGPTLTTLWLVARALSFRQVWRIVLDAPLRDPHDEQTQLDLARYYPAAARALARDEK